MSDNIITFTDDDEEIGPVLGPEYRASARLAQAMLAKFEADHMKPLVDKVADEFREKLWDDVRDWLLADAELNVHGAVRDMVEQTIVALLTGKQWAMERYPFADWEKGKSIRQAIFDHVGADLVDRRVADLEAELARAHETIKMLRDFARGLG